MSERVEAAGGEPFVTREPLSRSSCPRLPSEAPAAQPEQAHGRQQAPADDRSARGSRGREVDAPDDLTPLEHDRAEDRRSPLWADEYGRLEPWDIDRGDDR